MKCLIHVAKKFHVECLVGSYVFEAYLVYHRPREQVAARQTHVPHYSPS